MEEQLSGSETDYIKDYRSSSEKYEIRSKVNFQKINFFVRKDINVTTFIVKTTLKFILLLT